MPTRHYSTPTGLWSTDDVELLRLLHNDLDYVVRRLSSVPNDREFVATSSNYGNNFYYVIRRPLLKASIAKQQAGPEIPLFYLEGENLNELHWGLCVTKTSSGYTMDPVRVRFDPNEFAAIAEDGSGLSRHSLIFTAPAIIWNGEFVGWPEYIRATYDVRHAVALQYLGLGKTGARHDRIRREIQDLQKLWAKRNRYVAAALGAARAHGHAVYERLLLGIGGMGTQRYVVVWCARGTAEDVARAIKAEFRDAQAVFQIAEGGGTGILMGTPSDYRVIGPSAYRRGRVLCCLLMEMV
jgi:hypothetical protein